MRWRSEDILREKPSHHGHSIPACKAPLLSAFRVRSEGNGLGTEKLLARLEPGCAEKAELNAKGPGCRPLARRDPALGFPMRFDEARQGFVQLNSLGFSFLVYRSPSFLKSFRCFFPSFFPRQQRSLSSRLHLAALTTTAAQGGVTSQGSSPPNPPSSLLRSTRKQRPTKRSRDQPLRPLHACHADSLPFLSPN